MIDIRLLLKLGRRSRSRGARGRGGTPSISSGEVVYGIGLGEVAAGGESTSAMAGASVGCVVSGMRNRVAVRCGSEVRQQCRDDSAGVGRVGNESQQGSSMCATAATPPSHRRSLRYGTVDDYYTRRGWVRQSATRARAEGS
jgi:hypothetical protein